ncbi:MAG: hypothetical protein DMF60_09145 [Acidobacteria bacterium]|nr:MAG: hypothetical protein DMF60_09145 [Acidobacteriota bacterium]
MAPLAIFSDGAVNSKNDQLKFDRYVKPIVGILTNPQTETPFTIGIFGTWGSGKTTLLRMLDDALARDHEDQFVRVHFNPWIHRGEPNLLVPLLHALRDTLEEDVKHRFIESAKKIANVLLRLGANVFLKTVTASNVSLEDLEKLEKSYVEKRGEVESVLRRLHHTLQAEADDIAKNGAKVIFFVDDLDRCDPAQIIDLLEATKTFLDLRHVFVVLAVDKEVIDRGIEVKYSKFKFAEKRQAALGAEYLEKMVQLPLHLFPLRETQVLSFMKALGAPKSVMEHQELLAKLLLPNPRKIKRVLNILSVADEIAVATEGLAALNLKRDVVARLVVLQVQSGELYAEVAQIPDLLLALENVYAQKLDRNDLTAFVAFGSRAEAIQQLCKDYYRPESYLREVFKDSPFKAVEKQLATYLTMLGG